MKAMTKEDGEQFCQLLASLFYPPDQELVKQIHQGTLHSFFEKYIESWGEDTGLLRGFLMKGESENLLGELTNEYDRLFSDLTEEGISPVESSYKPWTQDPRCCLSFASERGLLMGDSALHLSAIYQQCGLEVADEFKGRPDHIAMELEFLSYLYQWATDIEIKKFIEDHLNWIPFLKEELSRFRPHSFYVSILEILDLFLNRERERLEVEGNGTKKIH